MLGLVFPHVQQAFLNPLIRYDYACAYGMMELPGPAGSHGGMPARVGPTVKAMHAPAA